MSTTHRTPRQRFKAYVLEVLRDYHDGWIDLSRTEREDDREYFDGGADITLQIAAMIQAEDGLCKIETRRGKRE